MQNDVSQPASVADHLHVATEAVRAAIHAVYDTPVDEAAAVGETYRAVGEVNLLVDRLPEPLRHLARNTGRLAEIEGIATDETTDASGHDAAAQAAAAIDGVALELATIASGRSNPLSGAHSLLGTLKIDAGAL